MLLATLETFSSEVEIHVDVDRRLSVEQAHDIGEEV
jgi:divalent metal cation (Fe/Co/Zn/Cd) transporter